MLLFLSRLSLVALRLFLADLLYCLFALWPLLSLSALLCSELGLFLLLLSAGSVLTSLSLLYFSASLLWTGCFSLLSLLRSASVCGKVLLRLCRAGARAR